MTERAMRAGLAALGLAVVAGSAAAGAYDGIYRPDAAWAESWDCRSVGMDGGALAVANDTLYGVENSCLLTNPTSVRGMAATLYDAVCSGEGESYAERIMLMQSAGGIVVVRDGSAAAFRRCP